MFMGRRRKSHNGVAFVLQLHKSQLDQKGSVVDYVPKATIKDKEGRGENNEEECKLAY